jgi:hypothetical protein
MKRLLAPLFLALFVSACETPTFSALDEQSPEWRLVFQDEFSGKGRPDPDKWISREYNRRPNRNGPDGWWDAGNAYLNGLGQLVYPHQRDRQPEPSGGFRSLRLCQRDGLDGGQVRAGVRPV